MSENLEKVFKDFVNDIILVFPEYKERLYEYYKELLVEKLSDPDSGTESDSESGSESESESESEKLHPKLVEFLNNIEKISDKVADKDLELFNSDPIILQNVSFKVMWKSDISDNTKNNIWKYLQTFCIIKINIDSGDKINDVIKSLESQEKIKDKQTFKNMKKLKKLNEAININEINKIITENPDSINTGLEEMDSLFKNTNIGKMAQEISEDLDLENMISGDGGGIDKLLNGDNMMNIIQKISTKVNEHATGENAEDLMGEATNICDTMKSNPLFSSLMGMQGQLFSSMGQPPSSTSQPSNDVRNINLGNHSSEAARNRLQKKLQEKKMTIEKVEK